MTYVPVPDPEYGQHVCRRAVRLTNLDGAAIGELEDSVHAIRCRIEHDGRHVTGIEAEFVRQPMSTCGGAMGQLELLVGTPLATSLGEFYADGRARIHCTHGYDLAWWTIAHAGRTERVRRYDSIVPDHPPGREVEAMLEVDHMPVLRWRVRDDVIQGPEPFAGRHAMKGFVGWAVETLQGDELEAALVLNKGYFTSQSHYFLQRPGRMGAIAQRFAGTCWTYMPPRLDETEQLPSRRNFDDGGGLLEFRP
jgi:hypothetical protein